MAEHLNSIQKELLAIIGNCQNGTHMSDAELASKLLVSDSMISENVSSLIKAGMLKVKGNFSDRILIVKSSTTE